MPSPYKDEEETKPLNGTSLNNSRLSLDSLASSSDTSIALERLNEEGIALGNGHAKGSHQRLQSNGYADDDEIYLGQRRKPVSSQRGKRLIWILVAACVVGWLAALMLFVSRKSYRHPNAIPFDPSATATKGSGKEVTLDSVMSGQWSPQKQHVKWIEGADGEDGLLLERNTGSGDYLRVEDVRKNKPHTESKPSQTLMQKGEFDVNGFKVLVSDAWPSKDLKKVLVISNKKSNWRHSSTGYYWIFDVASQKAEPLDPDAPQKRIQLAKWSPNSDAIVFTRDNNMYLRRLGTRAIIPITIDGGPNLFYGVPDWVYEEEVFAGNSATWWSETGDYIAFLRSNDTIVPEYPIQYFVSRPSGKHPALGEESYPEVRQLKYPKAGAPNPIVDLRFYDVKKGEVFAVTTDSDFPDDDRLITEVLWAGKEEKVIVKNTNRESDILKVALIDVVQRSGKIVRTRDVNQLDGGWFEVTETTTFVPGDPGNDRPHSGYVDTVIYEGYDHLGYFTPLDNPEPLMLTSGPWEVVKAPSAIDFVSNTVYFVATKESSIQRHVYSVNLDGTGLQHISKAATGDETAQEGYYDVSFSTGAGFALLSYEGPNIPWQEIRSTPSFKGHLWQYRIEENKQLAKMAAETELPIEIYSTINVDGVDINVVERRPPHFDENKRYPVLFQLYGGPGSQMVNKKFQVDFQSYVASNLGYLQVTVDGRGTGFLGRKARTIIRGHIGVYEGLDQIAAAKEWSKKKYVDAERIAIWGWSYGGFMTLKTIEIDGGETFKYGMAVAPVTDWRFYDSIYTERYMRTPQHNPDGYTNTSITDTEALARNVRFLIMHGVADDNVHLQNTLTLLDKLDLDSVENYDVHFFPDSDHSIYFHNANRMVYDKLNNWLINAFNGEWLRTDDAIPKEKIGAAIITR